MPEKHTQKPPNARVVKQLRPIPEKALEQMLRDRERQAMYWWLPSKERAH